MRRRIVGSEEELAFQLARYLQAQYPTALYHFDYGTGVRLTMGQAVKQKRLNRRAWPDLFIAAPTYAVERQGLFLELKKEGTRVYLKDGKTLVADEHVREQALTLEALTRHGYTASFAIGFDQAKIAIDNFLRKA